MDSFFSLQPSPMAGFIIHCPALCSRGTELGIIGQNNMDMITILLIAAGLVCFWLFFKAIDLFEHL